MNVEIFCAFEERPEVTNILVTKDNILHRKRLYLKNKTKSSIFKHNVIVFRNSLKYRPKYIENIAIPLYSATRWFSYHFDLNSPATDKRTLEGREEWEWS